MPHGADGVFYAAMDHARFCKRVAYGCSPVKLELISVLGIRHLTHDAFWVGGAIVPSLWCY